jgi:hypothetical protein
VVPLEDTGTPSIQQGSSNRPLSLRLRRDSKDISHAESNAASPDNTPQRNNTMQQQQQEQEDLSCGVHKTLSTRSGNMVTIWEDNDTERKAQSIAPTSKPNSSASSPRKFGPKGSQQTTTEDRMSRKSSQKTAKQGLTTPTGKTIGLGIGAATPGSLYDGDGFLKE